MAAQLNQVNLLNQQIRGLEVRTADLLAQRRNEGRLNDHQVAQVSAEGRVLLASNELSVYQTNRIINIFGQLERLALDNVPAVRAPIPQLPQPEAVDFDGVNLEMGAVEGADHDVAVRAPLPQYEDQLLPVRGDQAADFDWEELEEEGAQFPPVNHLPAQRHERVAGLQRDLERLDGLPARGREDLANLPQPAIPVPAGHPEAAPLVVDRPVAAPAAVAAPVLPTEPNVWQRIYDIASRALRSVVDFLRPFFRSAWDFISPYLPGLRPQATIQPVVPPAQLPPPRIAVVQPAGENVPAALPAEVPVPDVLGVRG